MRTFNNCLIPVLALLPAVIPVAARAGEADDQIVVTATRTEQHLSEVGRSISVIDRTLIDQRQTLSVAELLRTVQGVSIARNGGPGSTSSVFIRGAENDQTVALIDGVKLNDPSAPGGGFNFADLMTDNVERIEVLRGPQSVLWGSQAIGGVVNLITRAPTEHLAVNTRAEYGSHDSGHLTGNVSGRFGPVAASVGAGYLTTDGISVVDRAFGGAERDGYHLFGANAKAEVMLTDAVSIDLRGFYTQSRVDLDGFPPPVYDFADTPEYSRQKQIVGYAGINAALFDGRLRNRLAAAYTLIDRDNYDPAALPAKTFDARGRNLRFEYQGIADIADRVHATFGAEHEQQHFRTVSIYAPLSRKQADIDSVYGALTVRPVTGLNTGAGIRYDDHSGFGSATTLSADAAYSPNGGKTVIRASYGEGFKAPSLYQLYGDYGTPGLDPERAKGWDAGITRQIIDGAVEASATYFERRVTNQIDFDLNSSTYGNIARARARGVELGLTLRPAAGFTIVAHYTYTDAENRERSSANFGNALPRRPKNSITVSADHDWAFGLSTGASITHVSGSYDDAGNSTRLKGYALVDLRAAFPVTTAVELFGRIENLFDERYETAFRYGQTGRAAYGGVRLRY